MKRTIRSILSIFSTILILVFLAAGPAYAAEKPSMLRDEADVLTQSEEAALLASLERISRESGIDVAVITVSSLGGKSAQRYADDVYDYDGYSEDGILLLISIRDREYHMSTAGEGMALFPQRRLRAIEDKMLPYLRDDRWKEAIEQYAERCDQYLLHTDAGSIAAEIIDVPFVGMALVIGFLIALIVVFAMRSQLKTVKSAGTARAYLIRDSLMLTEKKDYFLYSTVSRIRRQQNNGGHTSSSGRSHGGRGGRF